MIILLKHNQSFELLEDLRHYLEQYPIKISEIIGEQTTVWGIVGDTTSIDVTTLKANHIVIDVRRVSEPYKLANRKFHPEDTQVILQNHTIGTGHFSVIAGPCSVESQQQVCTIAQQVKQSGATMLRGGAFKPRTSPYAFQGLKADGISYLLEAKKQTGLPIVSELMSLTHIDLFSEIDVIQVGARNMQNFEMLRELGRCNKPILLKRGLANTIEEFLMSAEYILAGGNQQVILCERGIRTYETMTRNTLDLSAVPLLKRYSHLPVVVDPSHATGISWLVEPLSQAAVAVGADGLMIEVHNNPKEALCDGAQSLTPEEFHALMLKIKAQVAFFNKVI